MKIGKRRTRKVEKEKRAMVVGIRIKTNIVAIMETTSARLSTANSAFTIAGRKDSGGRLPRDIVGARMGERNDS